MEEQSNARLFVAIAVPHAIQHELHRIQRDIEKAEICTGRFVDPYTIHVTLQFIGAVDRAQVPAIATALAAVSAQPMKAQLGRLDFFAVETVVRIMFVHLECPELDMLVRQITCALLPWLQPEERDFVGHLTLMRVKQVPDLEKFYALVHTYQVEPLQMTISGFALMESILTPNGPVYRTVAEYGL